MGRGHVTLSHSRFVSVVWASVAIGFPVLSTDRSSAAISMSPSPSPSRPRLPCLRTRSSARHGCGAQRSLAPPDPIPMLSHHGLCVRLCRHGLRPRLHGEAGGRWSQCASPLSPFSCRVRTWRGHPTRHRPAASGPRPEGWQSRSGCVRPTPPSASYSRRRMIRSAGRAVGVGSIR